MLVEAFFSTLVSFCLVQLLHNTENLAKNDRTLILKRIKISPILFRLGK